MKITISFKNLEHTPSLDEKIREKTLKLEKYLGGNTDIHWTCSVHDGHHYADIQLTGPSFQYHATANTESMYKTLDQVIAKIEKQLQKQKDKWKDKHHDKDGLKAALLENEDEDNEDND